MYGTAKWLLSLPPYGASGTFKYPFVNEIYFLSKVKLRLIIAEIKMHIHVLSTLAPLLYLQFKMVYCKQNWQDRKPLSTEFALQIMMTSPQLGHITNVKDFSPLLEALLLLNVEVWQSSMH